MTVNYERLYAARAREAVASEIREILKITKDPDLISFAGGIPNPDTFPISDIGDIFEKLLRECPLECLQYGVTEGQSQLRETLASRMKMQDIDCDTGNIMVVSGAQQALDLTSQLLLEQGRTVVTESPSFLAALLDFKSHLADITGITIDGDGIITDLLEEKLSQLSRRDIHPPLLYVIPNFQNPTGVTLSEPRRRKLIDIANDFDLLILEDDPYSQLRFEGESLPPIKSFDDTGRVIYASSFSKILSPGMRIGWMVAAQPLIRKMAVIKQTIDVSTNVLCQMIANEYILGGHLDRRLPMIQKLYGRKQKIMLSALEEHFPGEVKWTHPQGGMFLWVELPDGIDTHAMLPMAIERKVAYVSGQLFYPDGSGLNTMRLSFTHPEDEQIVEGIRRLGGLVSSRISQS